METPHQVRREWAERYNLPYFATPGFQKVIDVVSKKTGVGTSAIKHNPSNEVLVEGCQKLGYGIQNIPQNTAGHEHYWWVFFSLSLIT